MESAAKEPEQGVWDLFQGTGKDNTWTMRSQSRHISWNYGISFYHPWRNLGPWAMAEVGLAEL